MAQTAILEQIEDTFSPETGEITHTTRRTVRKKSIEPTDEFFKVSRYLHTIFAYHEIPLNLVGVALCIAQKMEFKTNLVYLNKGEKKEIADMLGVSFERVNSLVKECKKYDIIRSTENRGRYEVNGYLFSSGSLVDTRNIQAHFDFENDAVITSAEMKHKITGETVRKSVRNKQIPGQMTIADLIGKGEFDG